MLNHLIKTSLGLLAITQLTNCKNAGQKESGTQDEFPNIVYILADDMGYGDIRKYNANADTPTPNLDLLAQNGVRFTDAHSNSAVSTPTRYGILTGRYAFRTRLKEGVLWGYGKPLIKEEKETVASFLKTHGYTTACIGKWHLGLEWEKEDKNKKIPDIRWDDKVEPGFEDNVDYSKKVKVGPPEHGFDYSYIIPASLDMVPYCYLRNGKPVEAPDSYTKGRNQEEHGRGVFWRAGPASPNFEFVEVLPNFIDTACSYITRQADKEKPFFLYLPLPAPHTPWLPKDKYKGQSGAGTYGDFVVMVDDMIGRVIKELESRGLTENTLIIMTSDNGADWRPGDIEKHGHKANYIFKGRKADIYEAGHRVPFIARWDGVIPKDSKTDETMCTTDLMATLAGMLDVPIPDGAGEDSYNLWPAFTGESYDKPIRNATIHHSLEGYFAIRKGKWKYTPHRGSGGFTKPVHIEPDPGEAPGTLYNLQEDPREQNNLYKEKPEMVDKLSKELEKIKQQGYSRPGYQSKN
mgnify:CR=1 FL=1